MENQDRSWIVLSIIVAECQQCLRSRSQRMMMGIWKRMKTMTTKMRIHLRIRMRLTAGASLLKGAAMIRYRLSHLSVKRVR